MRKRNNFVFFFFVLAGILDGEQCIDWRSHGIRMSIFIRQQIGRIHQGNDTNVYEIGRFEWIAVDRCDTRRHQFTAKLFGLDRRCANRCFDCDQIFAKRSTARCQRSILDSIVSRTVGYLAFLGASCTPRHYARTIAFATKAFEIRIFVVQFLWQKCVGVHARRDQSTIGHIEHQQIIFVSQLPETVATLLVVSTAHGHHEWFIVPK